MKKTLELKDLKKLHDKAYNAGQVTRDRAADDLVFYWVTQWDDGMLNDSQLAYRGEFNILRKAGRQIMADLTENEVQVDFEAVDDDVEDSSEILDGLYRKDLSNNMSQEAFKVAQTEKVVCGYGAWELFTEYVTNKEGDDRQVIRRRPINEANNTVYFDPNAKLIDKSDATYCSVLRAYSVDGYKNLVYDITGEELDDGQIAASFKMPEESYTFPWIAGESKKIYVVEFYHRIKVKTRRFKFVDPFESVVYVDEADFDNRSDDLMAAGYEIEREYEIEKWQVKKYIASGADILAVDVIPGEHIPVVPDYGERAYIEGEEHYEGVTRLSKDPQRLRNFQMSYLADIVSRSPRQKPIFLQEQIAGYEQMYQQSGSENNYPYMLQNRVDANGQPLPIGAVAVMPEQPIPNALIQSIALSAGAVADVADPGVPQDYANSDLSGKAVLALQTRLDMQSVVYQDHTKYAKRRDGEIYASIASEIYDTPQKVKTIDPGGNKRSVKLMETDIDEKTGDVVTRNDISNIAYEVTARIGASYKSQKEQTVDRLSNMIAQMQPGDPMRQALMLKQLMLMDGVEFDDIREYANKQLITSGIKEPETEEEKAMVAQMQQQGQEPNAEMVMAQAELLKGQAAMASEKRKTVEMQMDAGNEQVKRDIDGFNAETKRMDTQIKAEQAGADIELKKSDKAAKDLDNQGKIDSLMDLKKQRIQNIYQQLTDIGSAGIAERTA